jgi:hypothetical protein
VQQLHGLVCKHSLVAERGQVVVVKGQGQPQCSAVKVKDSTIPVAELPRSDQARIEDKKSSFFGLTPADAELSRLEQRRTECKGDNPNNIPDCPSGRGR